jgi:hypothetical protein
MKLRAFAPLHINPANLFFFSAFYGTIDPCTFKPNRVSIPFLQLFDTAIPFPLRPLTTATKLTAFKPLSPHVHNAEC